MTIARVAKIDKALHKLWELPVLLKQANKYASLTCIMCKLGVSRNKDSLQAHVDCYSAQNPNFHAVDLAKFYDKTINRVGERSLHACHFLQGWSFW